MTLYENCKPDFEALMAYLDTFQAIAQEYGVDRERAMKHALLYYSAVTALKEKIEKWSFDF